MDNKCKMCDNITKEYRDVCSNECFMKYIDTEDFQKSLDECLNFDDKWYKLQIKQHRNSIKMYSEGLKKLEKDLIDKIGQDNYNSFIKDLENEESNNI